MKAKSIKAYLLNQSKAVGRSLKQSVKDAPPPMRRRAMQLLVGSAALLTAVAVAKWISVSREEAERVGEIKAGPIILVSKARQATGTHTITLIGESRPYAEAILYAKVSGYLRTVNVDKGDVVKKGQLLAVIESPETDQGYAAALADSRNKQAIGSRMDALFAKHLVSQQEVDQARADAEVSLARFRTEKILKDYETLRAPFDGTVTARFADPGALVQNATSSQSSALPVVTVSTVDRLRVDVFVDQRDAHYVRKDDPVLITLSSNPGFKLEGKVSRLSDELDPRTKMLLTEIDIPNQDKQVVAGSFVQVSLEIKTPPHVEAPSGALVRKENRFYVPTVDSKEQIHFKEVEVTNNDGKMLWIAGGLEPGERVALNIGDTIPEGAKVRPQADPSDSVEKKR
jgi:RND family efflux transporter MFP subunit